MKITSCSRPGERIPRKLMINDLLLELERTLVECVDCTALPDTDKLRLSPPAPKRPRTIEIKPELEPATSTTLETTPMILNPTPSPPQLTPNTNSLTIGNYNLTPTAPCTTIPRAPTQEWGIEEVIQYIESSDPGLGVHADLFRKHVRI